MQHAHQEPATTAGVLEGRSAKLTPPPRGVRRRGLLLVLSAATSVSLGLAACSSSKSSTATTTPSGSGNAASAASGGSGPGSAGTAGGVAAAAAVVAKMRAPSSGFTAPGPSLDAKSLRGKTIWYVALSQSIPVLAVEQTGIQQAASALGVTLRVCDGKFQPATAAACVNSAVSSGAIGVIMDSITTASVSTAITNATSHKVPVLAVSAIGTNSADVAYGTNGDERSEAVAADWIIADSSGKAKVLGTKVQDDTGAINDIDTGSKPQFATCPGCTTNVATYTSGTVTGIPSLVSASLLTHRDATYGFPQFDFIVPLFKSGVQTAGLTSKMKIVSTNAVLSSMQLVKSGGQAADIGSNRNYSGWLSMDAMLRMLKGLPVPAAASWQIPIRIFDKTNINNISLTPAAAGTGEWFGSLDYHKSFQSLWGLS